MKDSTGMTVITPTEFTAKLYRGETLEITDGNRTYQVKRLNDGRYSVNGAGAYTLEAMRSFYGQYHAEFGSAVFFPAPQKKEREMSEVKRLEARFNELVAQREKARMEINPDVEGSDEEYLRLEREVNEAYRKLMDARYEAGEGMLD